MISDTFQHRSTAKNFELWPLPRGGTESVPRTGQAGDTITQNNQRKSGHPQSHAADCLTPTDRRKRKEPPCWAPDDAYPCCCDRGTDRVQHGQGTRWEQRPCEHERTPIVSAALEHIV